MVMVALAPAGSDNSNIRLPFQDMWCYHLGMSNEAKRLLDDVLSLPGAERAEIAARLIESLEEVADASVDEAWAAEIERRCTELDAGEAVTSDWADVRRRIDSRLRTG